MGEDELRDLLAGLRGQLETLHGEIGEGAPTEEQQARWDELRAQHEAREAELRALVEAREAEESARAERARLLAESRARWASIQAAPSIEPFDGTDARALGRGEVRDRALTVVSSKEHTGHLRSDQLDKVDALVRRTTPDCDGGYIGRRLLLTETPHYRSAFQKMMTSPQPVLTAEESRALLAVQEFRAMSGGVDTAGGFAVPILIDPTIILTAQGSLNPFRRISRVETITTDEWRGVTSAGVTWSYGAEGTAVSDNSPAVAQPTVAVHEAKGYIQYSIRLGQDWPGFAAEMATLLNEGYDELQASKFPAGSGTNEPFGILTALDANTNVEVVVTTDGAFGGADINKVWGALPDRWKANAYWMMNHDVGNEVASFGNSNNLSFVTVDLTGVLETIRMRPVAWSSYFPDFTGTTGASNILVVGDFRNYLIADRAGMTVELIPHVFDVTNNRPTGERAWYAWARNGADSINDLGFRLLQNQ